MKHYIGKQVKLHLNVDGKYLFFNAHVIDVNENLISFKDRFDKFYSFRVQDIKEINGDVI